MSFVISKLQFKIRYHYTSIKMAKFQHTQLNINLYPHKSQDMNVHNSIIPSC